MNMSIECPPNSPDASKRGPKKRKKRTSKSTYDGGSSNDDSDDFVVVDKRKGSGGDAGVKSRGLHDSDGASDGDFVDDDERRQRKKKKFKSRGAENVKPNKRKGAIDEKKERRKDKNLAPKQQAEARQVSPEVQRLKDLAKRCGLVIPPACYKGQPDDEEMESRIGVYLLGPGGLPVMPPPSFCFPFPKWVAKSCTSTNGKVVEDVCHLPNVHSLFPHTTPLDRILSCLQARSQRSRPIGSSRWTSMGALPSPERPFLAPSKEN